MTNEERKALVERLRRGVIVDDDGNGNVMSGVTNNEWIAADQIEADGQRIAELEAALKKIEQFGHGDGHGRGYTCANIAEEALK